MAQINLRGVTPNIQGAQQQGLKTVQMQQNLVNQQRLQQLEQQNKQNQRVALGLTPQPTVGGTQQEATLNLLANDVKISNDFLNAANITDQRQRKEAGQFTTDYLQAPPEQRGELMGARIRKLQSEGRDASNTLRIASQSAEEQLKSVAELGTALDTTDPTLFEGLLAGRQADTRGRGAGAKSFAPVTLVNPETKEKKIVIPTIDPVTKKATLEEASIPKGFEISRETAEEKRNADILTIGKKKGAEITGKGIATRRKVSIDNGLSSSEGLANLKRARSLLDTVKTGGIDAVSLRAKQLFGVEGADEGELSNRLGKAVLKQLKATFGAAFSKEEGAGLARIEAGFNKSSPNNKRLLDQLIKMVEKKSKEGINAAVASKDFEAAKRIQDNLEFSLDIEPTLPQGVSEEDIEVTMKNNNMTREQVLERLQSGR